MKVLIADKFEQEGIDALVSLGCDVVSEPGLRAEDLPAALASHDPAVLIVRSTKVRADAIAAAKSLGLIVRAGSGYDNIDCDAAAAREIGVCNCPGMNAVAVAELAMGLLLCCDRRLPDQTDALRAGTWDKKGFAKARGLKGRVLGVVGLGSIGRELVLRARAFGMDIHVWSRSMNAARAEEIGASWWGTTREDLLTLAAAADAVSVHVALTDETKGLCDAAFFSKLKSGAYFINTARGPVVDEAALAEAVKSKGVRCGLDVWQHQPAPTDSTFASDLVHLPGVYGTHHCGASTDQAQMAVAEEAVRIIRAFKETGRFENRVNGPAVTPTVCATKPSIQPIR
ncbi:MAG: NAD(P)-dependent oxidoreductase [Planctomycetota bacterium]|nr:NAD(P)-dependent oxidoreductase [Planctomycetota bacterium]